MEVSNKHLVSRCIIKINKKSENFSTLFDTGATGETFMDKSYALQHNIFLISLIKAIPLQGFDGNPTGSGPVTHFVYIPFAPFGCAPQLTRLFITDIPQFFIMINFPWIRSKFTTIKLRFDVSTITFENPEQTTEKIVGPAETFSLAQLNNYQFATVEKNPDEKEPELPTISLKKKKKVQEITAPFQEAAIPSDEFPPPFETPFEIKMIATAPFFHVCKQKGIKLFSVSMKNVKKALQFKRRIDPVTKLPHEFHEFLELFSEKEINKLLPHRPYDHKINFIKKKQSGYGPLYSMSQGEFQVLKKFFDENLTKGFIRASSSPTASPILFARKPGGSFRFCVNYKTFNAITMKNRYPLPLIQETLNRLTRAKYFTKLNIVAAFNKIRMAENEKWKTAFRIRYGFFEFLIMNFGFCGAPSAFQNYINDILHEHLDIFCSAYIDDIFIYNKSKKKHARHIRLIFQKFQKAGLQLDIDKCEFYAQEVKYLGLIITPEGIKMDQEKIASVFDWPRPENLKNVQSFLGFANFYKRFIKDFSKHAAPLNALTKKDIFFQ